MDEIILEQVGPSNFSECGIGCLVNRSDEGYQAKVAWLQERFSEGLRYLLFRDEKLRSLAFLEYVPGEFAWRPVSARGWLFVHCLWVYPRGQKIGGLGSRLIQACVEEAQKVRASGVVAMVSDGPWMAGKQVFLKNGFEQIAERDRFQLVARRLRKGRAPSFLNITSNPVKQEGLHVRYSAQCPLLPKSIKSLSRMALENGLDLKVTILKNSAEAQRAPSYYGVYSLCWNGRLLSDHYVSARRFSYLLRDEIPRQRQPGNLGP